MILPLYEYRSRAGNAKYFETNLEKQGLTFNLQDNLNALLPLLKTI